MIAIIQFIWTVDCINTVAPFSVTMLIDFTVQNPESSGPASILNPPLKTRFVLAGA
jgi:hypothetical protein